jgi:hypothetical protein
MNETTIIIQFNSEKTPGAINRHVVSTLEEQVEAVIALGDKETLRALWDRLDDLAARVKNAEARAKLTGRVKERSTFDEMEVDRQMGVLS